MVYGYRSKLDSNATHMALDFTKNFLEELTKARESEQVSSTDIYIWIAPATIAEQKFQIERLRNSLQ